MRSILLLAVAAVLIAGQAGAVNLRFLNDTPASRFDEEDARLFQAALDKALNNSASDAPVGWSNAKTGGQGTITPVKAYQAGGRKCRDVRIANSHSGLKAEGLYKFCQAANGRWSLRSQ
jgi:surface antigen